MASPVVSKTALIGAFEDWFLCAPDLTADLVKPLRIAFEKLPEGTQPLENFCMIALPEIRRFPGANPLSIWKSNYLYRRLYRHQRHRLNPCPDCEGSWGNSLHLGGCKLCGSTGWLP